MERFNKITTPISSARHKSFPLDSLYKEFEFTPSANVKPLVKSSSTHQRNYEAYEEYLKEYADDVLLKLPYSPTLEKFKADKRRAKSQDKHNIDQMEGMKKNNLEEEEENSVFFSRKPDSLSKSDIIVKEGGGNPKNLLIKFEQIGVDK